jgi:CRP/FNR family transcriptional regulator, cyclic AMP receptor protein
MAKKAKVSFDPKLFLATVDGGRTVSKYRKKQTVFSQGDSADSVFYIQDGKEIVCCFAQYEVLDVAKVLGRRRASVSK